jgi:hypothetical protein
MHNIAFFTDVVMPSLIENITSGSTRKALKKWVIHIDKACPHDSRSSQECIIASKSERLLRSAYSRTLLRTISSSLDISKKKGRLQLRELGGTFKEDR